MKQKFYFFILIIVAFVTCKEEESAPKGFVEIDNIVLNDALYNEITCEVKANGTIESIFFEYSLDPDFKEFEHTEGTFLQDKYVGIVAPLQENSTYHIRCRVQNKYSSCVSNLQSFKTKPFTTPKVRTDSASKITLHSATLYGTLEHRGTNVSPEVGFCYAKHKEVTIKDSRIIGSIDRDGHYHIELTELEKNVFYYVRAYATNSLGTSYGEELIFETCEKPTVTTSEVTDISNTSATCGGNVTDDGGSDVTERGICYATHANPTISDAKVASGSGLGSFSCNLNGLISGQIYYVRAYAINRAGIGYGKEMSFLARDQNAIITYTASKKLQGFLTDAFGSASMVAHEFSNGEGKIVFDRELTSIGDKAFYECVSLTSITLPNSVTSIGDSAFHACSWLTSIMIPNGVTSIGEGAFSVCRRLTSINIPNGVTSIEARVFSGCSFTSITIPNNVTSIGDAAFASCSSLNSIIIPNSVTSIGESAFAGCNSLNSVTIGNGVTSIGRSTFSYCRSLTSITIPDNVTSVGNEAFYECNSLNAVTIGNSVTSIGRGAFYYCSKLTSIRCYAVSPPKCELNSFATVSKTIPVYVPAQSVSLYKAEYGWADFTNLQPINE